MPLNESVRRWPRTTSKERPDWPTRSEEWPAISAPRRCRRPPPTSNNCSATGLPRSTPTRAGTTRRGPRPTVGRFTHQSPCHARHERTGRGRGPAGSHSCHCRATCEAFRRFRHQRRDVRRTERSESTSRIRRRRLGAIPSSDPRVRVSRRPRTPRQDTRTLARVLIPFLLCRLRHGDKRFPARRMIGSARSTQPPSPTAPLQAGPIAHPCRGRS